MRRSAVFGLDFLREASFTLLMLSRQKETHGETPLGTVSFFFPTGYSLSELAPHQVTVGPLQHGPPSDTIHCTKWRRSGPSALVGAGVGGLDSMLG